MGKIVHSNRLFKVERQNILVRGKRVDYYRVLKNNTSAILPLIDKSHILLERQLRSPVGLKVYEIPAGHLKKGDTPLRAAKRELEEETGYKCSKIRLLTVTYPSPGILSSKEYIFVAEGLRKGRLHLDKDEEISLIGVSLEIAIDMIKSGEISDAKSIVAILYYCNFILGQNLKIRVKNY
jgi:ADP-ribose pyrophosphatase